tara:strand:+ start:1889 stop:2284 length:396 start_codon:yes stop_codon:yes gene_type:complete
MSVDTKFVLSMFRNEYSSRLNEVIGEADVFDEDGNLILSPDLKVRHKGSGLEYTIDHIDDEESDVKIHLRSPESPRFEPPPEEREILGEPRDEDILGEQDVDPEPAEVAEDENEVVFVIDQAEFEKDYEVD